jgi:hypothetical protein
VTPLNVASSRFKARVRSRAFCFGRGCGGVGAMNRRLFLLAALALGGCATAGGPPVALAPARGPLAELEPLYSAQAGRDGLTIQVASNGCTAKPDFAFYVERRAQGVTLAFGRKHVDACKSSAQGRTELAFTWQELGLSPRTPVFLLNPLAAVTWPGA